MASDDSRWKFIAITLAIGFLLFQLYQMELFNVGKFHHEDLVHIVDVEGENQDPCPFINNTEEILQLPPVKQQEKSEDMKEIIVIRASQPIDDNNHKLDLSFLDAPFYKDRIFKSNTELFKNNRFLNPFQDFMQFQRKENSKSPGNFIFFDFNASDPALLYCSDIDKAGIGNFLAQYWASRGIAYLLGMNFKMIQNKDYDRCWKDAQTEMFDKYFNNNPDKILWCYYLPKYCNDSIYENHYLSNIDRNKINVFILQIIESFTHKESGKKKYSYKSRYRLLYYNPLFLPILVNEAQFALNQYFNDREKPKFNSKQDVVIHIRCGDILSAGGNEYGFMTLKFYDKAFEIIKANNIDNDNKNKTIWILSQLGDNSLRADDLLGKNNLERKNTDGCNHVVLNVIKRIQEETTIFNEYLIMIEGNNPLNVDFYRMANAPNLICGMSTFCEQAALSNNNNVILPIYGPWIDLKDMIEHGNVWIPDNHYFVNNSLHSLELSSQQIGKNKMNPQQIVDHIMTH